MDTVKVPPQMKPLFDKAHEYVSKYFANLKSDPAKGVLSISEERYILVRAASMSVEFFETIKNLYRGNTEEEANHIAYQLLFDISHAIGKQDAKNFHKKMNLKDPIEKLSAGPIHFAFTGWSFVEIFPESKPLPNEDFYLIYDHPYSFESSSWIENKKDSKMPVCVMNSGYSSGWCEESFGIPLVASEIMCKAKGDKTCRFIMGHPSKIKGYITKYITQTTDLSLKTINYEIPGFFKRKELEEQLRQSEERYRTQFEESADAIFLQDIKTRKIVDCNKAAEGLLGMPKSKILQKKQSAFQSKKDIEKFNILLEQKDFLKSGLNFESTVFTEAKQKKYVSVLINEINITGKKLYNMIFRDITLQKIAEKNLKRRIEFEQRLAEIAKKFSITPLKRIDEPITHSLGVIASHINYERAHIFLLDKKSEFVCATHTWTKPGVNAFISIGDKYPLNLSNNFRELLYKREIVTFFDVDSLPSDWCLELAIWKKLNVKSLVCVPLVLQNNFKGFIGFDSESKRQSWNEDDSMILATYSEIIIGTLERKKTNEKLEELAKMDSLTILPNRLFFEETLRTEIEKSKRHNFNFALLSLDLDNFKYVNDTFGHDIGDLLLVEVAKRLKKVMRLEDFIARLGGDEFVSILMSLGSPYSAGVVAQRIVETIGTTYKIAGHEFITTVSVGIAIFPQDGDDFNTIQKHADIALYQAKRMGKNSYEYYHKELSESNLKRIELENHLYNALKNKEFYLCYQPKYDLTTNKIVGTEALLRWKSPNLGIVLPDKFIGLLEEKNIIIELGEWIFEKTCQQYKEWMTKIPNLTLPISINLSVVQLVNKSLYNNFVEILRKYKLDASLIELELTETSMMKDSEHSEQVISKLADHGFKIVIDDFGVGYSSLIRLKNLPISTLKIDKSFVQNISKNNSDEKIVQSTIALAKSMDLDVVAEGIENSKQIKFLIANGCLYGQGYYLSKPLEAKEMEKLLTQEYKKS